MITMYNEQATPEQFRMAVGFVKTNAEIIAQAYADLAETPDGSTRTFQAAACFTAAAASKVAENALKRLTVPNGEQAAGIEGELAIEMFNLHSAHRTDYEACLGGNPKPIPSDVEPRKVALKTLLERLVAHESAINARIAAAPESAGKSTALMVMESVQYLREGVEESVALAAGVFAPKYTDEQIAETVQGQKRLLMTLAEMSEEEAQSKICELLGSTPEKQRAAILAIAAAQMAVGSEGTTAGVVISAEQENDLANRTLDHVEAVLS